MKQLPNLRDNVAIEREFKKKLVEFSKKCNSSIEYWLLATLNKIKNGVVKDDGVNREISTALRMKFNELYDFWEEKSNLFAYSAVKKHLNKVNKWSKAVYKTKGFNIKSSREINNLLKSQAMVNVNLIKSIPRDILERFQNVIINTQVKQDTKSLLDSLKTIKAISYRRAKTIARDQTQKAIQGLNIANAMQYKVEYYQWDTSHDERVSKGKGGHVYLQGRIYKYTEPSAVIDSYGNKGHAGARPNCRCSMIPLYLEANESVKKIKDSAHGDYYVIIKK